MGEYRDLTKEKITYFYDKNFSYHRINLNENATSNDSIVRAIMKATNQTTPLDWIDIYRRLSDIAIEKRRVFNDIEVIKEYLFIFGYTYHNLIWENKVNLKRFCERYPEGKYILIMYKYAVAYTDNIVYDNIKFTYNDMAASYFEDKNIVTSYFVKL